MAYIRRATCTPPTYYALPDGDTVARSKGCSATSLRAVAAPEGLEPVEPRPPPRRRLRALVLPQLLLLRGAR